ncbi:uncharacterized protein N7482_009644 [Penicillium canariense]|uniref:NodB homology domain-containing protein n=1 Tax=Penicillium canariense TaxID=189055 RepID=A0A9W9HRN2_9EURO|nr:uncharacterized protein N7482_009644 [Penicillium canariense]KAJ5153166.1 hypothetical protein N7482_009644 [Penicillium canariense]
MRSPLSLIAPAFAVALLLPAATSLVHGPYELQHWFETRHERTKSAEGPRLTPSLVIDTFQDLLHNDLGFWHGTGENLTLQHEPGSMRLFPTHPDQNFHTQFNAYGCFSLLPWQDHFLHVVFEGNEDFTVSLNENNAECSPNRAPFPGVPDSVQASRYVMRTREESSDDGTDDWDEGFKLVQQPEMKKPPPTNNSYRDDVHDDNGQAPAYSERTELFIPLSHFRINQHRVVSVSFSGFYTKEPILIHRVEFVSNIPAPSPSNNQFTIPEKLPTGQLVLRCSRPNSFAFGIDDGQPQYAQDVMRILDEEDVRATFFAVAAGLRDSSTNFTTFYQEMLKKGHQVALHSNTHPRMEGLPTLGQIDQEIVQSMLTMRDELGIDCTSIFPHHVGMTLTKDPNSLILPPPFGTVGARMRQQLAQHIRNPYIVNWSVDVEDWLWANTSTPEKQLEAFYRDIARGGNLAVMHFLDPTTVAYLPQFIRHVRDAGLHIMRVDQCLEDPNSPNL